MLYCRANFINWPSPCKVSTEQWKERRRKKKGKEDIWRMGRQIRKGHKAKKIIESSEPANRFHFFAPLDHNQRNLQQVSCSIGPDRRGQSVYVRQEGLFVTTEILVGFSNLWKFSVEPSFLVLWTVGSLKNYTFDANTILTLRMNQTDLWPDGRNKWCFINLCVNERIKLGSHFVCFMVFLGVG